MYASGIVFSVSERPVCRSLTEYYTRRMHTGRSLRENIIIDAALLQFDLLMMSTILLETCTGL